MREYTAEPRTMASYGSGPRERVCDTAITYIDRGGWTVLCYCNECDAPAILAALKLKDNWEAELEKSHAAMDQRATNRSVLG